MASVFEEPQTKQEQRKRLSDGLALNETDAAAAEEKFDPIALMDVDPRDSDGHAHDHEEMTTTRKIVVPWNAGRRLVLNRAGNHCGLPPTVDSPFVYNLQLDALHLGFARGSSRRRLSD